MMSTSEKSKDVAILEWDLEINEPEESAEEDEQEMGCGPQKGRAS